MPFRAPPASRAPSSTRTSRCARRPPGGRTRGRRRPSASPASVRGPRPCRASTPARPSSRPPRRRSSRPRRRRRGCRARARAARRASAAVRRDRSIAETSRPVDRAVVGDQPDALAAQGRGRFARKRRGPAARLSWSAAPRWCGSGRGAVAASRRWAAASHRKRRARGGRRGRATEMNAASRARTIAASAAADKHWGGVRRASSTPTSRLRIADWEAGPCPSSVQRRLHRSTFSQGSRRPWSTVGVRVT